MARPSSQQHTHSTSSQSTTMIRTTMIQGLVQASSVEDDAAIVSPESFQQDDDIPLVQALLLANDDVQDEESPATGGESDIVSARLVSGMSQKSSHVPRPEFLYVSAIKPAPESSVGLRFVQRKNSRSIHISKITSGGLFDKSGLQVGDQLLAVNSIDCTKASLDDVLDMIHASECTVSLCVRNEHGDPHFVLNSVQKPARDMKVGIFFLQRQGALIVTNIREGGLFADSLIAPNHRCYFLNGEPCDNKVGQAAADLAASADRVTIISRARGDLATVLSVGCKKKGQRWPWKRASIMLRHHAREYNF